MNDDSLQPDTFDDVLRSMPNIPDHIPRHIRYTIEQGQTNQLIAELKRDARQTAQGLDRYFSRAAQVTAMTPRDVLEATGFSWRDIDPSRIQSAIAQLRAIFFLDSQGFVEITLIPAQQHRSADMTAKHGEVKYAAEVFNSIYEATERFTSSELASWAFSRWTSEGKASQVRSTSRSHDCKRGILIAVISTQATAFFQTHGDFLTAAQLGWRQIGSPVDIHVCMVTGRETPGYGPDDAVFPPFPSD
jgi:hypothetical protein